MRHLAAIIVLLLPLLSSAQTNSSTGPREVSPAMEEQMRFEIEQSALALKASMIKENATSLEIEIALDTFRIDHYMAAYMEVDNSDAGMRLATYEAANAYDSLMNKYYRRLLAKLDPADKKTLIAAQRAWIQFRDANQSLVETLAQDEYSGGGTIQRLILAHNAYSTTTDRTLDIIGWLLELERVQR